MTQESETMQEAVQCLLGRGETQLKTTKEGSAAEKSASSWCAVHLSDGPTRDVRGKDDGVLLTVPARIYGKQIQALIDSGATRCFITPAAVLKCGLRTVPEETVLELADGRKLLSVRSWLGP